MTEHELSVLLMCSSKEEINNLMNHINEILEINDSSFIEIF